MRITNRYVLPLFLQLTVTSTSCSPCGKSAGTPTRASCTTCGSESAVRSSRGDQKRWLRPYCPCSRRVCRYHRLPASTTYRIRRSCCTLTGCTTCSVPPQTVAQVINSAADAFHILLMIIPSSIILGLHEVRISS